RYRPALPARGWRRAEADSRHSRFREPRSPARRFLARQILFRCAPAYRDIVRRVAVRAWRGDRSSLRANTAPVSARTPVAAGLFPADRGLQDRSAKGPAPTLV